MKVLIIPEDPALDRYILKPIVERIFSNLGRRARVQVLSNPRLRGVAQAIDPHILADIINTYPMVDLFLVMIDRDGVVSRSDIAKSREQEHSCLLACLAIEEIEVWMLALHQKSLRASFSEIRSEANPKERFAQPFLAEHASRRSPGRGRAWAMRSLRGQWKRLLTLCSELHDFEQRIGTWLKP